MGRIQSKRATADTNIVELLPSSLTSRRENPCTFGGFVFNVIDPTATIGSGGANQIVSIYSDNTGTGTTNLIMRFTLGLSAVDTHFIFDLGDNGILCHSGLRIECDDWTNLEAFVMYC